MHSHQTLVYRCGISISGHQITHVGMGALCKALATNTSVVVLDLDNMRDEESVVHVCDLLRKNTRLQRLDIMPGVHGEVYVYAERYLDYHVAMCVLEALRHNTTLQSLCMFDDEMDDEQMWRALATTLQHNVVLNPFHAYRNMYAPAQSLHMIIDALCGQPRYHRFSFGGMGLH